MKSKLSFWSNNVPLQISKSKRNIIFVFSLLEGRHCFKEIPFKLALYYNFNGSKYEQKCSNVVLVYQTLMWGRGFLFLTISCSKFLMWNERLKFPLALSTDQSSWMGVLWLSFPFPCNFHITLPFTRNVGFHFSLWPRRIVHGSTCFPLYKSFICGPEIYRLTNSDAWRKSINDRK